MSFKHFPLSVLIISSTPPLPRDYGNRNRVFQTMEFFKERNFRISFLLYPFDQEWAHAIPENYPELVREFEYFGVVPNSKPLHQNAIGEHHKIDEWWDETIGQHLSWIFQRKHFDVLFVNYTFFSKAFEYMPKGMVGLMDTHDLFSGRKEMFADFGVAPEFFYTTSDEEKIAFERADGVIAIKRSEDRAGGDRGR